MPPSPRIPRFPQVPDPLAELERKHGLSPDDGQDDDDPLAALERKHATAPKRQRVSAALEGFVGKAGVNIRTPDVTGPRPSRTPPPKPAPRPTPGTDPRLVERVLRSVGKTPRTDVRPDQSRVTPGPDRDGLIERTAKGLGQFGKQLKDDPIGVIKEEIKEPFVSGLRAMNQSVEGDIVSPATLRHGDPTGEKTARVGTRITKQNTPGALTREEARQARIETLANTIAAPVGIGAAKLAKKAGVGSATKRAIIGVSAGAAPVGAAYSPDDPLAGALGASVVAGGLGALTPKIGQGVGKVARGGAHVIQRSRRAARMGASRIAENTKNVRAGIADALHPERAQELRTEQERRNAAERRADTDQLTGLPNRAAYERAKPAAEADAATALVRFDVDGFKGVNDALGHQQGDKALKGVAQIIRQAAKETGIPDRVFRVGGDEFSAIVPADKAETFTRRAEELYGSRDHGQGIRTSLSGGRGATDIEADKAAYARKATRKGTRQAPPAGTMPSTEVATVRTSEIIADPQRFQFKGNVDEKGVGRELKGVQKFNPMLAGVLAVWRDPANGKTYVVNGHHRLELASRTGQESVNVRYIDAPNAETARAYGALINISEGRGRPIDAAKFFRDTGLGTEGLEAEGVSLTGSVARDGLALSRLVPDVFDKVASGRIPEGHGVAIGRGLETEAQQRAASRIVESSPRQLTTSAVEEIVAQVRQAGEATVSQETLFGQEQLSQSLIVERAEIAAELKRRMALDKNLFGYVTRGARASELERAGNVINVVESSRIAETAAVLEEAFGREAHAAGPIARLITDAARRVAAGEKARSVVDGIYESVREAVQTSLERGATGSGAGGQEGRGIGESETGRDADRGQEATGPEEEGQVRDSTDPDQSGFFSPAPRSRSAAVGQRYYRETNIRSLLPLLDPSITTDLAGTQMFVSTTPELALGQGTNKGVLVEFDAEGLRAFDPERTKPGAEFIAAQGGGAEKVLFQNRQDAYLRAVRSFTLRPDAQADWGHSARLRRMVLPRLLKEGWSRERLPDGSIRYTRAAEPSTLAVEREGVDESAERQARLQSEGLRVEDLNPGELEGEGNPDAPRFDVESVRSGLAGRGGERITAAAIRLADGRVFEGVNHADAIVRAEEEGVSSAALGTAQRGFATSARPFVNPHDALSVAQRADQLRPEVAESLAEQRRVRERGVTTSDVSESRILGEPRKVKGRKPRLSAEDVIRVAEEMGLNPDNPAETIFQAQLQLEAAGYRQPTSAEMTPHVQRLQSGGVGGVAGTIAPDPNVRGQESGRRTTATKGRTPTGRISHINQLRGPNGEPLPRLVSRALRTAEGVFEVEEFDAGGRGRWEKRETGQPVLTTEGYLDSDGNFWTREEAREMFADIVDIGPEGVDPATNAPLFSPEPGKVSKRTGELDLFGNDVTEDVDAQTSLLGGDEGTEASRSLAQQEVAARAELDRLRQLLAFETDPTRKAQVAQRIAALSRLVNREKAISADELEARAIAGESGEVVPPNGPDQTSLFSPLAAPTPKGAVMRAQAGIKKPSTEKVKSLIAISRGLSAALDVPLRQGRFKAKLLGALGVFFPKSEVIRVRRFKAIGTVVHENGHWISKEYLHNPTMMGAIARGAQRLPAAVKKDLQKLGKDLYGNRKPTGGYGEEGIAQVARFYVTDRAKLLSDAPAAAVWWQGVLQREPALKAILDQAHDDLLRYEQSPDNAKIASLISVGEHTRVRLGIKDVVRHFVDDLVDLREMVDELGKPKSAINDAYVLARLTKGNPGRAKDMIDNGVREMHTRARVTRGLTQILGDVGAENLQAFREYLVARQVITKTGQNIDTGFDVKAAQAVVQAGDKQFGKLAEEVWDYRSALLAMLRDVGLLTPEQFDGIRKKNPTPTPFYRQFDPSETGSTGGGGRTMARNSSGVHRMVGSDRPIIDPLESLVKDTFHIVQIAEKHHAATVGVKLALRTDGGGRWVEEIIETPQEKRTIHLKKVLDQLSAFGFEMDDALDPAVAALIVEKGKLSAFYDKSVGGPRETKDLVLPILVNGKRRWFAFKDRAIWDAIQRLDEQELQMWERIMAIPATTLRTGATLAPDFIGVNPLRDMLSTSIYSRGPTRPPGWHLARGVFELARKGEAFDQWVAEGGLSAGLVGADRIAMQRTLDEITRGKRSRLYRVVSFPKSVLLAGSMEPSVWGKLAKKAERLVDPLRAAAEFAENANRLGEFVEVRNRATKGGATKREAAVEGAIASRDLIDFRRAGIQGRVLNRIIAFFNAAVQDNVKFLTEHNPKNLVDSPESRARMLTVMARGVAWLTVPSVALYLAQKDDPIYQEIPEYVKATGWVFITRDENGEPSIWWIPRPHLLGIVYGYMPEKALQYIDGSDPEALKDVTAALYDYGVPPLIPTAVRPVYENIRNRSTLTDRPIEPRRTQGLEPRERATPYTGETARTIGDVLNQSPAKIENLVSGYGGGLGRLGIQATDALIRDVLSSTGRPPMRDIVPEAEGIEAVPLARRFHIPQPGVGSESVGRVIDAFEAGEEKRRTWRAMLDRGQTAKAAEYLAQNRAEILSVATAEDAGRPGELREIKSALDRVFADRRAVMDAPLDSQRRREVLEQLSQRALAIARQYLDRQRQPEGAAQ